MGKGDKMIGLILISLMALNTLKYPVYELEEIVVTATRIYQLLKDVPITTTLITRKQIDGTNAKDVGEVIRDVAGVDIKSYGTPGTASSVSLRGSTSQQVLVLVDGRPINSVSAGSANLSKVPLNNVERIEVVRGPTSHLYGANAMGGVVNIITKEPQTRVFTKPYGSYGTFNTHVYGLEHGGKFSNFGYLATGEMKKSDGFRDNSNYGAADLSVKLGYDISSRLLAKANFLYHDDEFGLPGPVPPENSSAKYGNEKVTSLFDRLKDRNVLGEFNLLWKPTHFSSFTFKNYFDHNKLNYIARHDDWWHWTSDTLEDHNEYISEIIGGSVQYQFNLTHHTVVAGGADIRKLNYIATQRMININTGEDTTSEWNPKDIEYGVWIEGQRKMLNLLAVTSGIRYDCNSEYGSEVNPNMGVVYFLGDNSTIRASLGKAYRAPSFNDLYWPTGGNPDLKPEFGWSGEVGLTHTPLSTLTIGLSVFDRETKDKIAWAPDTGGIWRPQNVNKHSCRGGEFEIKSNFSDRVSIGLTYTYLDAEQTNRETVYYDTLTYEITKQEFKTRKSAFTPSHEIGVNLMFKPIPRTQLNLRTRWVDRRVNYYPYYHTTGEVTMDTKTIDSYFVMNTKLILKLIKNLGFSISVDNILDEDYMEQFGTTFKDQGYPLPSRSFTLGMNLNF